MTYEWCIFQIEFPYASEHLSFCASLQFRLLFHLPNNSTKMLSNSGVVCLNAANYISQFSKLASSPAWLCYNCQQIHIGLAKKLAGKKVVLDAFLLSTQKCSGKTFLGGILIRLFLVTFLVGIVWFGKDKQWRG